MNVECFIQENVQNVLTNRRQKVSTMNLQLCLHNSVYFNYTFTMNEDETVCNIYVSCLAICVYKAT